MTQSNRVMIFVAWIVVGVPLTWGVYKTIQKSMPLFTGAPAASAPAVVTPAK